MENLGDGMDLVAENLDGAVVLNIANICTEHRANDCRSCVDIGGLVHNWLLTTNVRYVLIDLQDEKDVCSTFLVELIQLRKRLRIPFLFAGVMDRPQGILEDYNFAQHGAPTFSTPEGAIEYLKEHHAPLLEVDLSAVKFGEAIVSLRARQLQRVAEGEDTAEAED